MLVATGCGGGSADDGDLAAGQAPSTTVPEPVTTTTAEPTTSTSATTRAPAQTTTTEASVLRRRDGRPADVAAQADYYLGGPPPHGFACENDAKPATSPPNGALAITFVAPKMVAGEATTICVGNYEVGVPVKFQVTVGGRSVWQAEVAKPEADLGPSAVFATMPLDPTGAYTVTVTQKDRRVTKTFQLEIARNQPILVVAESPGRGVARTTRGKPVRIGLAGWTARQRVELVLYRSTSTEPGGGKVPASFITRFTVTVDANGQQVHVLQTRADDPTGCYVVNTRPEVEPAGALGRLGPSIVEFCLV
jgi:hypothetical protein